MDPLTIAKLIILFGFPLADKLVTMWLEGKQITPENWGEIRELAKQTPADRMRLAIALAGVPLDSQKAKDLLALTES